MVSVFVCLSAFPPGLAASFLGGRGKGHKKEKSFLSFAVAHRGKSFFLSPPLFFPPLFGGGWRQGSASLVCKQSPRKRAEDAHKPVSPQKKLKEGNRDIFRLFFVPPQLLPYGWYPPASKVRDDDAGQENGQEARFIAFGERAADQC